MNTDEYLAYDAAHAGKHEFNNGEVVAMAGASEGHVLVATNLGAVLRGLLRGRPCRVYGSDLRVQIAATGAYVYPALSVVCGPSIVAAPAPGSLQNPGLLVEVLSSTTAAHDRGAKAAHYRQLASLRAYMFVDVEERRVEVYFRAEQGPWQLAEAQGDAAVTVPPLDVVIPLGELWTGLEAVAELA